MGIKKLLPFLKSKGALKPFLGFDCYTKVAIDVPIFAHKFIYIERTYDGLVRRFHRFALDLIDRNIEPVFVFDGTEKMELKNDERKKRSIARDKQLDRNMAQATRMFEELSEQFEVTELSFQGIMFPTKHEYGLLEISLKEAGLQTYRAKYEAEALCAHLNATNQVGAVLTEDTDAIPFGSTRVIFKWTSEEPLEYNQEEALKSLGLSMDQLIELCCLFGCDFCDNIYNVGPVGSFDLIRKHGTWSSAYDACRFTWPTKTQDSAGVFNNKFLTVKQCFLDRANEKTCGPETSGAKTSGPETSGPETCAEACAPNSEMQA
jgi:5'-3' exonuclease